MARQNPNAYRERMFRTYQKTHIENLDHDEAGKQRWFMEYTRRNYAPLLKGLDRTATRLLEIGCNKGFLLACLANLGFTKVEGIDLSPEAVDTARRIAPGAVVQCLGAREHLRCVQNRYDCILMKAVLEHLSKDSCLVELEMVRDALKPGGWAVIDVPNMDWLFASHERYMDFTHESGFTKESLAQLLGNVFPRVEVVTAENVYSLTRLDSFRMRVGRAVLGTLLRWAEPQGAQNPIWARSIIGVARKDG